MIETGRYYRSSFDRMRERSWTVIPWPTGQPNQAEVLAWLRANGTGEFYYCSEPNKFNDSIVIKDVTDAGVFKEHFGVEEC